MQKIHSTRILSNSTTQNFVLEHTKSYILRGSGCTRTIPFTSYTQNHIMLFNSICSSISASSTIIIIRCVLFVLNWDEAHGLLNCIGKISFFARVRTIKQYINEEKISFFVYIIFISKCSLCAYDSIVTQTIYHYAIIIAIVNNNSIPDPFQIYVHSSISLI